MTVTNNNLYSMSDDDFLNADPDQLFAEAPSEPSVDSEDDIRDREDGGELNNELDAVDNSGEDDYEPEQENGSEGLDDDPEITEDTDQDEFEPNSDESEDDESTESVEDDEDESGSESDTDEDDSDDDEDTDSDESGSQTETDKLYEELMAPLKHHGSEFQPKDVAEARRLMSMGLDYARKTRDLKEQRKLIKMLDTNKLLDEDKLSFAIDLMKGDKNAIAQLVQTNGIDVMELEEGKEYTPSNYAVSDSEVELDDVIESIRSTPTFSDTMNVVTNWDESSKRELASKPQLLSIMNEHKANGIYDKISTEVQRERMLGGLAGLSDVEAYQAMGNRLFQQGAFNDSQPQEPKREPKKVVRKPKPKADETQLQDKRRKASPSQNKGRKPQPQTYDWWNMSDEEFEKVKL